MQSPIRIHPFLEVRPGAFESYEALWHGRAFPQEKHRFRVDRLPDHCELTSQILDIDESLEWRPIHTQTRRLTPAEWTELSAHIQVAFWLQPARDTAAPLLDGDCWWLSGYRKITLIGNEVTLKDLALLRDGQHHQVYRHMGHEIEGNGNPVYALGAKFRKLASGWNLNVD